MGLGLNCVSLTPNWCWSYHNPNTIWAFQPRHWHKHETHLSKLVSSFYCGCYWDFLVVTLVVLAAVIVVAVLVVCSLFVLFVCALFVVCLCCLFVLFVCCLFVFVCCLCLFDVCCLLFCWLFFCSEVANVEKLSWSKWHDQVVLVNEWDEWMRWMNEMNERVEWMRL